MDYLNNQLLLEVTIAEIFICFLFASAGFTLRALINRGSSSIGEFFKKSFVESIIVIGSAVVISLMINPFIEIYSKRLVALAPFMLGIIGMDFVKQLLSINSLFNLVTRAFKVFGFFQGKEVKEDEEEKKDNKKDNDKEEPKRDIKDGETCPLPKVAFKHDPFSIVELNTMQPSIRKEDYSIDKYTVLHLIENSINNLNHDIDFIRSTYYRTHDHKSFLEMYLEIIKQYDKLREITSSVDDIPYVITSKIIDLVKKRTQLDELYKTDILDYLHSESKDPLNRSDLLP